MDNLELNELMAVRRHKLDELKKKGIDPFASRFMVSHGLGEIVASFGEIDPGAETDLTATVAGRIFAFRRHGKASFVVLGDDSGRIQLYLGQDKLGDEPYELFSSFDIGDIVGVTGKVFKTRRGELSIMVEGFSLLTKSLRPLPEKWHGLKDVEKRHRERYVDLLVNPQVKEIFIKRSLITKAIRRFLDSRGFLEVETPMLQSIPGGATARPFVTHHNALDIDLYLRIAPELYLKRLLVGGFERVYEMNRNFRNEGMSARHNPEFSMLEVYQAYADYHDMMELTQSLIKSVATEVLGGASVDFEGDMIDFEKEFTKYTMLEAIEEFAGLKLSYDMDLSDLRRIAKEKGVEIDDSFGQGKIIAEIFEKLVEGKIVQPTFILDYPVEITPLAKLKKGDPNVVERFELIVAGREIANAFSELTDPIEQRIRFERQQAEKDEEAHRMDEDFVKALEYGMPPAGGLGIGVDRLVMLLTDSHSIQEVILFPQMRPKSKDS